MSSSRNVYLKMKTIKEAREILFGRFSRPQSQETEILDAPSAVGRVLAEPVFAKLSSPNFHASAMDGIAVRAEDTFGASEAGPRALIAGENAFYVNTGHVIPEGCNAVIMIEHLQILGDNRIEIEAPAFPWQYIRKMGEDIVATELLFPRNHRITPYCVGALIAGGIFNVTVQKKPRLLIIPTGNELVDWQRENLPEKGTESLKSGQVLDSNTYVLGALAEACGAGYKRHDMLVDDLATIKSAVDTATTGEYDMVLIVGGSSAGSEDFAKPVIAALGEVMVHGVTMMPGKPVLLGDVNDKPVFGIPGYPVSAIVAFEQFVKPLIERFAGQAEEKRRTVEVEPTRKITSKLGMEEFLRVKLGRVGERIVASSLPRGSGTITSITEADGIIRIPNHMEGLKENEPVTAELLSPLPSINNTIVAVGSHDNTLDILSDQLRAGSDAVTLSSSHVGSMGGIMALKRGLCHMAGSHLLDPADGSYNVSYIRRFLKERKVKLVNLVLRDQGLIIPKGNPKNIKGIEDLAREELSFINRQSGAGTRILLDYKLGELGMDPAAINGYENEEYTHMSVAVAVLSGTVDSGLGIHAAAKALDLDFIPVVTEQYDLVIAEEYFDSENIRVLLETINSPVFKERVNGLGGYSTEMTGKIIL